MRFQLALLATALTALVQAGDIIDLGLSTTTISPAAPPPEVSVVGVHLSAVDGEDVHVLGTSVSPLVAPAATQTQCFAADASVQVYPTMTGDYSPDGYQCWLVYNKDGGVVNFPLPHASSTSTSNKNITLVLPIVVSLVGLISIVGAILVFIRYRSRAKRESESRRSWVHRPGGWSNAATQEVGQVGKGVTVAK